MSPNLVASVNRKPITQVFRVAPQKSCSMKIIVEAAEDQAEEARQIVERRWSLAACRRPWPSNPYVLVDLIIATIYPIIFSKSFEATPSFQQLCVGQRDLPIDHAVNGQRVRRGVEIGAARQLEGVARRDLLRFAAADPVDVGLGRRGMRRSLR